MLSAYFIQIESDGTYNYITPFECGSGHLSLRDGFGTVLLCERSSTIRNVRFAISVTATTMVWERTRSPGISIPWTFFDRVIWKRSEDTADFASCTEVSRCPAGTEVPNEAWVVSTTLEGVYQLCVGGGVVPEVACADTWDTFIIFSDDGTAYRANPIGCGRLQSTYTEGSQVALSQCNSEDSESSIYEVLAEGSFLQADRSRRVDDPRYETYQRVDIPPPCISAPSGEPTCR